MFTTNRDYPFIVNNNIIEWDIRSANTSLMRYYQLYDDKTIDRIADLPKGKREVAVGKLMRKDKEFAKALESSFNTIVEEFLKSNALTMDDIVSIKKDAVFVKNHSIKQSVFGSVEFIPKNQYKHVLLLPKYEFYLSDTTTDVKGIDDAKLELHQDGMIYFVRSVLYEASNWERMNQFLKEYLKSYKEKLLDFNAYREFTSDSIFRLYQHGYEVQMDEINEDDMDSLDISYNFMNIILPTLRATV